MHDSVWSARQQIDPDIKRIAFIGSPGTARQIQKSAADVCVKHISLELGGKNPMIVFPDADLERAKDAAVRGMNFAWQGQSCGSTSRLLVHDSLYDEFVESVVARVRQIRLGNPALETSTMGPINSKAQYDKVCNYVEVAKADGARLVHGGRRPAVGGRRVPARLLARANGICGCDIADAYRTGGGVRADPVDHALE
ncbi:aldehyde dehydrogenase family protein [Paraburkholderia fungorum]|uniref:aldehyde dehydrogenase family protein n=1 Tax=Paraburkholderia fungorum TaxID=134537 RepID=UPI0038B86054